MSALGQKRTLRVVSPKSALPPKADIAALSIASRGAVPMAAQLRQVMLNFLAWNTTFSSRQWVTDRSALQVIPCSFRRHKIERNLTSAQKTLLQTAQKSHICTKLLSLEKHTRPPGVCRSSHRCSATRIKSHFTQSMTGDLVWSAVHTPLSSLTRIKFCNWHDHCWSQELGPASRDFFGSRASIKSCSGCNDACIKKNFESRRSVYPGLSRIGLQNQRSGPCL
jgi:hypothetical protein